ncbi:MAG: amidase [Planctomycetaceae bacterium]|jgi:aspartyl-tRNA(Asn)/glutamyl-tRNA(Gln) amidotransferase subunit A
MQPFPGIDDTLADASRQIQNRRASCTDIVRRCLDRIDTNEADIRAWVAVDRDGALEQAARLDAELAAGSSRSPLHGAPIGIKDIVDVAGFTTGAGSEWWSSQPPRTTDATLVARLRAAGTVILGKTVTTQFACFDPPPTRNPWNLDRTPAGSSSGSGAAVAAGHCLAAIGSQTGGSITRPAAFCGIAGCKPSLHRIPIDGVVPIAKSLDHPGPMARTVEDLTLMMSVLLPDFQAADPLTSPPILGQIRGFSEDRMDAGMREALEKTLEMLAMAGAQVEDLGHVCDFSELLVHHRRVMAVEGAEYHRAAFASRRDDYLPCAASLIEAGLAESGVDYVASKNHQSALSARLEQVVSRVDAVLTPAATGSAPDTSTTGDPCMNAPWSYTGLPTVSFPVGLSDDGLPLSVQLTGKRNREASLLTVAAWCEAVVHSR